MTAGLCEALKPQSETVASQSDELHPLVSVMNALVPEKPRTPKSLSAGDLLWSPASGEPSSFFFFFYF